MMRVFVASPVLAVTFMLAVICIASASCSTKYEFLNRFATQDKDKLQSKPEVAGPLPSEPNSPNQPGTVDDRHDDTEAPAVDVAGVHLVSDCFDLETPAKKIGHTAVHCTLTSDSPEETPNAVSFTKISIRNPRRAESYDAIAMSADPHPTLPAHFLVSSANEIAFHIEIPTLRLTELKPIPVELLLAEVKVGGELIANSVVFRPRINDYFRKSSLCNTATAEVYIPINFNLDTVRIDKPSAEVTPKYNVRWGFESAPDLQNLTNESGQALAFDLPGLRGLNICQATFTQSITLNWSSMTNHLNRKFYMVNELNKRYQLLMTDAGPVDSVFKFSPDMFISYLPRQPAPVNIVFATNPTTPPSEWCLFGQTGCIGPHDPIKDEIFAGKIPSPFLAKNLNKILENKLKLRVVNSFHSGQTKNDCFPLDATVNTHGSAKGADTIGNQDLCDATIPAPPTVSGTLLKIRYLAP